jgi:hypothetical protein
MAAPQAPARRCPACHSDLVLSSRSRGMLEDFYFIVGGELCRCQNCEARHAFFRRFTLPLGKTDPVMNTNDATNLWLITGAIVGGIVACLVIAILTLRRFHRWPF